MKISFIVLGWESHEISVDTGKDIDSQLQKWVERFPNDMTLESAKKAYEEAIENNETAETEKTIESEKTDESKEPIKITIIKEESASENRDSCAYVLVEDTETLEKAEFCCRNIFDFGYTINPNYEIVKGKIGGLESKGYWEIFDKEEGWCKVRKLSDFEKKAMKYLRKFPPIDTGIRL